jgi:hypothetical protein
MPDFIPRRDANFASWSKTLSNQVSADFAELGVPESLALELAEQTTQFVDAYRLATSGATAGRLSTLVKNQDRQRLEGTIRAVARLIRANPNTTAETLAQLQLEPAGRGGALSDAPPEQPNLNIERIDGRIVHIKLTEWGNGARRRPAGVPGATIFYHIGEDLPLNQTGWTWYRNTGATRLAVRFPVVPPGTRVWLSACWFNTRFDPGPWSTPMTCHLGSGGVQPASAGKAS